MTVLCILLFGCYSRYVLKFDFFLFNFGISAFETKKTMARCVYIEIFMKKRFWFFVVSFCRFFGMTLFTTIPHHGAFRCVWHGAISMVVCFTLIFDLPINFHKIKTTAKIISIHWNSFVKVVNKSEIKQNQPFRTLYFFHQFFHCILCILLVHWSAFVGFE